LIEESNPGLSTAKQTLYSITTTPAKLKRPVHTTNIVVRHDSLLRLVLYMTVKMSKLHLSKTF